MKTLKLILGASLIVSLCLFLMTPSSYSKPSVEYGIGGKMIGLLPSLVGTLDINQFGAEVGGGMWSIDVTPELSNTPYLSLTYYYANGKYIYPLTEHVQPYVGAGMMGVFGSMKFTIPNGGKLEATGRTMGYDIFGGLEFSLSKYGLPVRVYGGANYLGFSGLTLDYEEIDGFIHITMPFNGINLHVGLTFEF